MTATHNIEAISFEQDLICLRVDGQVKNLPFSKVSKKLEFANDFQRNLYTISPPDYGIHWPLINEDLSVDLLLKNI